MNKNCLKITKQQFFLHFKNSHLSEFNINTLFRRSDKRNAVWCTSAQTETENADFLASDGEREYLTSGSLATSCIVQSGCHDYHASVSILSSFVQIIQ